MLRSNGGRRLREYWERRATRKLLRTFNCAESTVRVAQDMTSRRDGTLLRASAGLAGGVVAGGSTCGTILGGALGMAQMHDRALRDGGPAAEMGLLSVVGDHVDEFRCAYGTTLCRSAGDVDCWTLSGFVRYLIPPDRLLACVSHIQHAMRFLHERRDQELPAVNPVSDTGSSPRHCARPVVEAVRWRTGVGNPLLERASVVFDGGVGLRGGVCGALVGAVLPVSALMWVDLREASRMQGYRDMLRALDRVDEGEAETPEDAFAAGGRILSRFKEEAGALECSSISGKAFSGWDDFQAHRCSANGCSHLIEVAADEAVQAIERHRRRTS